MSDMELAFPYMGSPREPSSAVSWGRRSAGMSVFRRQAEMSDMELATTIWGRTGFDGDAESGIAGRGAWPLHQRATYKLKNDNNTVLAAA